MVHKQVVIVGGGPIGLVTAHKMAQCGYQEIVILDAGPSSNQYITHEQAKATDGRVLALSYASYSMLEELGVWDRSLATPIKQVHISHSGLGVSKILAEDVNIPELGYTIKYSDLCYKLHNSIKEYPQIVLKKAIVKEVTPGTNYATVVYENEGISEYLTADMVILAEGGKIKLNHVNYKEYDYNQVAIIATLNTQLKHNNIAFERFDDQGALVLLPHNSSFVLVWSCERSEKEKLQNSEYLSQKLSQLKFMKRFGAFEIEGKIHAFDLKLQVAEHRVLDRVILVGNSAQIVHPVSAQGLNLGLRDVNSLMELIGENDALTNLHTYDKLRKQDAGFVIQVTHFLAKFMEKTNTRHLRGLGLIGLSNCKPIQNKLANSLIFGN